MRTDARSTGTAGVSEGRLGPLLTLFLRYGPPRWSQFFSENLASRAWVIAIPYLWLLIFFMVPFLIVLKISFAEFEPLGRPPYADMITRGADGLAHFRVLLDSYAYLLTEPLYLSSWGYSLMVAAVSTVLCLLLGYPMAYAIARASPTNRNLFLMLVILPF